MWKDFLVALIAFILLEKIDERFNKVSLISDVKRTSSMQKILSSFGKCPLYEEFGLKSINNQCTTVRFSDDLFTISDSPIFFWREVFNYIRHKLALKIKGYRLDHK